MAYADRDVELLRQIETYRVGRGSVLLLSVNNVLLEDTEKTKSECFKRETLKYLYVAYDRCKKRYDKADNQVRMWRDYWYTYGSVPKDITAKADALKSQMLEIKDRIENLLGAPLTW